MVSSEPHPTNHSAESSDENNDQTTPQNGRLGQDQLRRWAALIVKGEADFPDDLHPGDRELLLCRCRLGLRQRLVRLVARAIALDIYGDPGQDRKAY